MSLPFNVKSPHEVFPTLFKEGEVCYGGWQTFRIDEKAPRRFKKYLKKAFVYIPIEGTNTGYYYHMANFELKHKEGFWYRFQFKSRVKHLRQLLDGTHVQSKVNEYNDYTGERISIESLDIADAKIYVWNFDWSLLNRRI